MKQTNKKSQKIRYGIVGLGHIAQVAVLPAFQNAKKNSVMTAFVSGDPKKKKKIAEKYKVQNIFSYDEYDQLLESGLIDAVYICLPNHMHSDFAKRAMRKGIHVLCEKPLAISSQDCREMIETAENNNVKLMTAYRLHFDPAYLKAVELARKGKIGEVRYFNSSFSFLLKDPTNIRLKNEAGGGTLWDIGVYCLNAARSVFKDEPLEIMCMTGAGNDRKFEEVEESAGVIMKFPGDRIATFVCSFGTEATADFLVMGTKGKVYLENSYEYKEDRKLTLKTQRGQQVFKYKKADQFAPELLYFSDCVLKNKVVEPSGYEGWADVVAVEAMYESAATGKSVQVPTIKEIQNKPRLNSKLKEKKPAVREVEPVGVRSPY